MVLQIQIHVLVIKIHRLSFFLYVLPKEFSILAESLSDITWDMLGIERGDHVVTL